jgi:hypothetical protein
MSREKSLNNAYVYLEELAAFSLAISRRSKLQLESAAKVEVV